MNNVNFNKILYQEGEIPKELKNRGMWWLHYMDKNTGEEDWVFSPFLGNLKGDRPVKPEIEEVIIYPKGVDVREIDLAYYTPFVNYSSKEVELFKKPTKLKHFQGRVKCLIKRRKTKRLVFLPKGEGNFFLCLKLYVLNLIPTINKELTRQIYFYLYEVLGDKELQIIIKNYANYLKRD